MSVFPRKVQGSPPGPCTLLEGSQLLSALPQRLYLVTQGHAQRPEAAGPGLASSLGAPPPRLLEGSPQAASRVGSTAHRELGLLTAVCAMRARGANSH